MTFHQAAAAYLSAPGLATLADLHRWIQVDLTYDPAVEFRSRAVPLLEVGNHRAVVALLQTPGLFLSPSAHSMLSRAYLALGDVNRAQHHRNLAAVSLVAIRDSGDGTLASPWRVLRLADQHDALQLWGRRSVAQSGIPAGAATVDAHTCDDGSTAYFIVEAARQREGVRA